MAKYRDIITKTIDRFDSYQKDHEVVQTAISSELSQVLENHQNELDKIKSNYETYERYHFDDYLNIENEYLMSSSDNNETYQLTFQENDKEISQQMLATQQEYEKEQNEYQEALKNIDSLKKQAYQLYQDLTKKADLQIDKEYKVHQSFIQQEDEKFNDIQQEYHDINSEQSNLLLWTIEKSKNALIELKEQFQIDGSNQARFMNEAVLKVIEELRITKNKMNALFKSSTEIYNKQKQKIESLGHQRQKPHSQLNQTIIHRFVKQIKEVNQRKSAFEKLIHKEFMVSKEMIGKRIIEANEQNNKLDLERYILQYEILDKKSAYLLKKNQAMADLLISKYQNEIKKIKVDSFKRAEEIKLAYFMPAAFYQNSINLYSNFAFYVNESFDHLDNVLSELIRFNQQVTSLQSEYMMKSTKTLEDYKLNVMVRMNQITSTLTDLISQIDFYSKEVITLESKNQLEIASLRKQMENAEIAGDYKKHIRELEESEFFVHYQHGINQKRIDSEHQYQMSLLSIQNQSTNLRQSMDQFQIRKEYLLNINRLEKKIHDLAFDKELAYAKAIYEKAKAIDRYEMKVNKSLISYEIHRLNYEYANAFIKYEQVLKERKEKGSRKVIELIHRNQSLIDFEEFDRLHLSRQLLNASEDRTYAYYLESVRNKMIQEYQSQTDQKTAQVEARIREIHQKYESMFANIKEKLHLVSDHLKQRLIQRNEEHILVNMNETMHDETLVYSYLHAMKNSFDQLTMVLVSFHQEDYAEETLSTYEEAIESFVILIEQVKKRLSKKKKTPEQILEVLDHYYIKTIESLEKTFVFISEMIEKSETLAIQTDVLYLNSAKENLSSILNMINEEYDQLIYEAVMDQKNQEKQMYEVYQKSLEIESKLKGQVKHLNETFLNENNKWDEEISHVEKEVAHIIQENIKMLKDQVLEYDRNHVNQNMYLDERYHKFEVIYTKFKIFVDEQFLKENQYIESLYDMKSSLYKEQLTKLESELNTLPVIRERQLSPLEKDKDKMMKDRKNQLLHEFAHIEEEKFLTRPRLLKQIEEVKNRLPEDYLKVYQNIQSSEEKFLHYYLEANQLYTDDFQQFVQLQNEYQSLFQEGNVIQDPFNRCISLQEKLYEKAIEAYKDTLSKSKMTKTIIQNQEQASLQKQDRIINQ